jgi:hypothetical protein
MWSILAEAPAVQVTRIDVGVRTAGTQTGYTSYDARGGQNRTIGGLVTRGPTPSASTSITAFDEVSVGTASHPADMGWHGRARRSSSRRRAAPSTTVAYADYQNESIQAHASAPIRSQGAQGGVGLAAEDVKPCTSTAISTLSSAATCRSDKIWHGLLPELQRRGGTPNFPVQPHQTALQHYTGKAPSRAAKTTDHTFAR